MTDPFEQDLRTIAHALASDAPPAPTLDEIRARRVGVRRMAPALVAAAAVISAVAAVPLLLGGPGDGTVGGSPPGNDATAATTATADATTSIPPVSAPSDETGTTDVPDTAPEATTTTTRAATTTTVVDLPALGPDEAEMALQQVDDLHLRLVAARSDEEDPPTATVRLQVFRRSPDGPVLALDEQLPDTFFWNVVSGPDAVCELTPVGGEEGRTAVKVRVLLSPSLGCSDPYTFPVAAA